MFRTSLRDVAARKMRLLATGIAILLGVAFMAGTLVLTDTIGRTFNHLFADVNAGTDAYVRSATSIPAPGMLSSHRTRLDDTLVDAVAHVDGVAAVHGTVKGYAQIVGADGKPIGKTSGGPPTLGLAWTDNQQLNPFRLIDGHAPQSDTEVVVDRASARAGHLGVGAHTKVLTQAGPMDVTVAGIARFGSTDSPAGASAVLFTDHAARAVLAAPGKIDAVTVTAAPGVSQRDLAARITRAMPPGVQVLTGAQITAENQSDVQKNLRFFTVFLLSLALVSLVVGAFIIYNTFSILVAQRTRETALLRAIGASRRQVVASVLVEAGALGLVASAAGLAMGIGVAAMLRALMAATGIDLPGGSLVVAGHTFAAALGIGLVVCLASAIRPALRASRVPAVAAMRRVAAAPVPTLSRRRAVVGVVLAGLGLLKLASSLAVGPPAGVAVGALLAVIGLVVIGHRVIQAAARLIGTPVARWRGVSGSLASENARRNPKRTATTSAALTVGVAMVALIAVLASSARASIAQSISSSFTGDFVVDSGAMQAGGVSHQLAEQLGMLPQVDAAVSIQGTIAEVRGEGVGIVAADPAQGRRVADLGQVDGSLADVRLDTVAVSRKAADKGGFHVGDTLAMTFPDAGLKQLRIAAVYAKRDLIGDYLISPDTYQSVTANRLDLKVMIKTRGGVSADAARRAIGAVAAGYPQAKVLDRSAFANSQTAMIDQLVNMIDPLLALAIVIALIGIANTLALSILERTGELGLLRAVGMTRGQIRSAVRWEAVIVTLLGTLVGVIVGVSFGWGIVQALASQGITAFRVPVPQLVIVTVVAAMAGVVAAAGPARRASKLNMLDAIAAV